MSLSTYARRVITHLPSTSLASRTSRTIQRQSTIAQCTCSFSHSRTFFSAFSTSTSSTPSSSSSSTASTTNGTSTSTSTSTETSPNTSTATDTTSATGTTTTTAAAAPDTAAVEKLTKQVAEKDKAIADKDKLLAENDKKIKELHDRLNRQFTETEIVRKRGETEIAKAKKFAIQSFAKSLLEIADTLILASKAAEPLVEKNDNQPLNALYEGVKMTEKILHKVFSSHGVKKFDSLGEKCDPNRHEVVFQMDDPTKEAGTIAHVMKDGYVIDDRVLRAATVGTVKARPKPATPSDSETPAA